MIKEKINLGVNVNFIPFILSGNECLCPFHDDMSKWVGGDRKIVMYRGTPAQFFFQSVDLVIFKADA